MTTIMMRWVYIIHVMFCWTNFAFHCCRRLSKQTRSFTYFYSACDIEVLNAKDSFTEHKCSLKWLWHVFPPARRKRRNKEQVWSKCVPSTQNIKSLNGPVLTVHYVDHLQFFLYFTARKWKQEQNRKKNKRKKIHNYVVRYVHECVESKAKCFFSTFSVRIPCHRVFVISE